MEEREFSLIGRDIAVDLSNCAQEPIHIPGRIQPHGVLLAIKEPNLTILQVSDNIFELLGVQAEELLNQPLEKLLGPSQLAAVRENISNQSLDANPLFIFSLESPNGQHVFDGIIHRMDGLLILELEQFRASPENRQQNVYNVVKTSLANIQNSTDVETFCQIAAEQVKALTGFDRVMVYRFDEEWNGEVVGEAKEDWLDSFRGLHYPASDIPEQARRLYVLNWLRLISDVNYQPSLIIPTINEQTHRPLDLSYSVLRSVSPIHIEYLKNMGVGASMSISLLKNEQLWGLIACHHYQPKYIPYDIRTACEFLGQVVSLQLVTKVEQAEQDYKLHLKSAQTNFIETMANEENFVDGLTKHQPNILSFIEAGGVAICVEDDYTLLGQTPPEAEIKKLVAWLGQTMTEDIFVSSHLVRAYQPAEGFQETGSGLLAVEISKTQQTYILWFRPEVVQTVNWGGDPNKAVSISEDGVRLSPRKSFELWKQTVRSTSLPWQAWEIAGARDLRGAIVRVILRQAGELARLNAELNHSNQELDAFAYIASHDLKEPLRGIHNYSHFLLEDYIDKLDEDGIAKLNTLIRLTGRMEDLIDSLLHYSRVGRLELGLQETDLNEALHNVQEMLQTRIRETGTEIRIPRPLPTIYCDQTRVEEVFSNLISNALKYNNKPQKWIEIGYLTPQEAQASGEKKVPDTAPLRFYVRDNGIGIQEKYFESIFRIFKRLHSRDKYGGGNGAGLTIVQKIIERHGGKIWVKSTYNEGSTFYFTLQTEENHAHSSR